MEDGGLLWKTAGAMPGKRQRSDFMLTVDDAKTLELLRSEYKRLMDNGKSLESNFFSFSSAICVVFAFLVSLKDFNILGDINANIKIEDSIIIALSLPFIAMFFYYNLAKYTIVALEYAGHATVLERKMNNILHCKIFIQESEIRRKYPDKFYGGFCQLPFWIVLFLLTTIFFFPSLKILFCYAQSTIYFIIAVIVTGCWMIFLFVNFYMTVLMWNARKRAEEYSRSILLNEFHESANGTE
jgi:hypothetical protein